MSTPATTNASSTSSVSGSASAATPTVAVPVTKKPATQLAASADAVTLAKAFVAKYDAAVVAYLISQKSRVYNDVPALVKPFVAAEWSTLVALINYSTPVIAEAFFAAMEDYLGAPLSELATGLIEDAVRTVAAATPVFATDPVVPASDSPVSGSGVVPAAAVGSI